MHHGAALRAVGGLRIAPTWSRWHLVAAVQVADAIAILSASALSLTIRCYSTGVAPVDIRTALIAAFVMALVAHCVLRSLGAYDCDIIGRTYVSGATAAASWLLGISPVLLLIADRGVLHDSARDWITGWFLYATLLIISFRGISARASVALLRSGQIGHTICIVGSDNEARSCARWAQRCRSDIVLLGCFWFDRYGPETSIDAPWLGQLADLPKFLLQHRVDELVVAIPSRRREAMDELIFYVRCLPVSISIWPESIDISTDGMVAAGGRTGNMPLLRVSGAPLHGWLWVLKDVQDRLIALFVLLLCLPVLIAIALSIRLTSPGPVFFHQTREGYCGREFRIFKFRTMHALASPAPDRIVLATKEDSRFFPFGALLRRTSLDELPQLLNVLAGDMWLVGPRPHSPLATAAGRLYSDAVDEYAARHRIKPGITGWAQVNGWRGPTSTTEQIRQRVAHDLFYIENWSPLLDWRILIKTAMHGFVHENAF